MSAPAGATSPRQAFRHAGVFDLELAAKLLAGELTNLFARHDNICYFTENRYSGPHYMCLISFVYFLNLCSA